MDTSAAEGEIRKTVVVDIDGTLLKTDLLHESAVRFLAGNPFRILRLLQWSFQGPAVLKSKLAEEVRLEPEILPFHEGVIEFIERERGEGSEVVLVSAANETYVQEIASHLNLFDSHHGSSERHNLKGVHKSQFLQEHYSDSSLTYVGDSPSDMHVWGISERAVVVTDSDRFFRKVSQLGCETEKIAAGRGGVFDALKAIRVYQWVKNLLILVAPLMAHTLHRPDTFIPVLLAFLAFSFTASSVYLVNDLVDLGSDRVHPTKRFRPLASGKFSVLTAVFLAPLLIILGIATGSFVSLSFLGVLLFYLLTTVLYTFLLKQIALVDIFVLASLYTLRVLAGGIAVSVDVSPWLLAFSLFIFLSLACIKRFSELLRVEGREGLDKSLRGRGYNPGDLEIISQFGVSSGALAVLVLALYTNSAAVQANYSHPTLLWLICPLVFYWITRAWLIAHRGRMNDDPIVFALRDQVSYLIGILSLGVMLLAI